MMNTVTEALITRIVCRTDSVNKDFIALVSRLDKELAERDGADNIFYSQYNKTDKIRHVVIIYENGIPMGCGAMREFSQGVMEIKRMFTEPAWRGKGIASAVVSELELWAKELNYRKCILETGKRQPEAISLYKKSGYRIISNYGPYAGIENSVCFEKDLE